MNVPRAHPTGNAATSVVIVPTYNERDNVGRLATAVLAASPGTDILFVDDDSPDGTGPLLDEMAGTEPRVFVLHRGAKQGIGRAYVAGFAWALARDYDFILEMDADLSHDPADVPRLLAAAKTADLVIGSRYVGGIRVVDWPLHRLALSRGASVYVRVVTGLPVCDPTGGFKCFRRATLEAMNFRRVRSNGYSFQIEMTHDAWMRGFAIQEVPITFIERRSGHSKMTNAIVLEAVWMIWRLWLRAGCRRSPRARHPRSVREARAHREPS